MTTDRLFVIMLVILIPMTGCFGAVDNADAQDDTVENTSETIVNNYYNNTTTIVEAPVIEKFTAGGMIDFNSDDWREWSNGSIERIYSPYNFSTIAGELVTIHFFKTSGSVANGGITTICDDGTEGGVSQVWNDGSEYGWGSHANCVHTVDLRTYSNMDRYESGEYQMAWSLVYSIEYVTVV